ALSYATPSGESMPACVVAAPLLVKLLCPSTLDAFMPSLMEDTSYTSTRLLSASATNRRLFAESSVTSVGRLMTDCDAVPDVLLVKLLCPSTFAAFSPLV